MSEFRKAGLDLLGLTNKEAILLTAALIVLYGCYRAWKTIDMRRKMPPGPMGVPFVGNKNQIPPIKPWWTFEKLNKAYGEQLVLLCS